MKKLFLSLITAFALLLLGSTTAEAVTLVVDNNTTELNAKLINSTTYVPLRAVTNMLCPGAEIQWESRQAIVRTPELYAVACPDEAYLEANGRMLYIKDGVKLINGSTMVPVRVLAKALGAEVDWQSSSKTVYITSGSGTIMKGEKYYDTDSVYWLSRIINAESAGEPLKGKIAVGNVVLNRVACTDFPNSIYDVIFDYKWGVQFEPAANGTIYNTPTWESILAAKLCLDGASVAGDSLYFLNPAKSSNFWAVQNCNYYSTIGNHVFYS